jgi:hypothetical protein
VVNGYTTDTSITSSLNPANSGQTVTFTATVKSTRGVPTGSVTFSDGSTTLAAQTLNNGVAIYSTSSLSAGSHTITAAYGAGGTFAGSTGSLTEVINGLASTTALAASPNPANALQQVTLTATVKATTGAPTGTVRFFDGGVSLGSAALAANGTSTLSTSFFSSGAHSLTATYAGDSIFNASTSSPYSLIINGEAVHIDVSGSPNPAETGSNVTFTANVSAVQGFPGGSVSFMDGNSPLGPPLPLTGQGVATLSTSSLAVGTHSISASFAGTANFLPGVSAPMQETIVPFTGDFSVLASPAAKSVYPGESASFDVNVAAKDGFHQALTLSCTGLPELTTCAFSPASLSNGSGASKVVIQSTPAHKLASGSEASRRPWETGLGTGLVTSLALLVLPCRLRRHVSWLALLIVFFALSVSGCGGPGELAGGTPPGTYHVGIAAAVSQDGQTLSHSTTVTLTVKSLF